MQSGRFAPAQIDFYTPLKEIGESLGKAIGKRRLAKDLAAIPNGPNGETDYGKMVSIMLGHGRTDDAVALARLAQGQAEHGATSNYRNQMLDIRRQELGQRQPAAPAVHSFFDESGREVKKVWNGSEWVQQGGAKSATQSLTNVDKQAILEADERVRSATAADSALERALQLNKQAYSGPLAGTRGYVSSLAGRKGGEATEELSNVVIGQALEQLKGIFGGMPTEGERKILIDLQGSVNQAPAVRERIFQRAKEAVTARKRFYGDRARSLRGGTFYQDDTSFYGDPGAGAPSTTTAPLPTLPAPTPPSSPQTPELQADVATGAYGKQPQTPPPAKLQAFRQWMAQHPNDMEAVRTWEEFYGPGSAEFYLQRTR